MSTQQSRLQDTQPEADQEIRALYQQLLGAWNKRNPAGFAAMFAEDGNMVGFDGSPIDGRAAIQAHLEQIFADHQTAAYVGKIREVRLLAADAAILRAVSGMVPPGQSDLNPSVNTIQSLVAVKREGHWRIALYHNTPAQFHGMPDAAQQLTEELRQLL